MWVKDANYDATGLDLACIWYECCDFEGSLKCDLVISYLISWFEVELFNYLGRFLICV